jgi:hypothetical protein
MSNGKRGLSILEDETAVQLIIKGIGSILE